MREKPNSLLNRINDIRQIVASAENYSLKRMMIIFSNSEYRIKDIPGIDPRFQSDLREITMDCMSLMETNPKAGFESYSSRLGLLLDKIVADANPVFAPAI